MSQPKARPEKRVVSKREYARYLSRKIWLCISALSLVGWGIILVMAIERGSNRVSVKITAPLALFVASAAIIHKIFAKAAEFKRIEPVKPLTRFNIGRLPAEETLVRAAAEPTEEQKAVLLRAAQAASETPSEQLLRPGMS